MEIDLVYPALSDLKALAKKRMPTFVYEYLDSATGRELGVAHNRHSLDEIRFLPAILRGEINADLTTKFLGKDYDYPFGIAPIGMSGMIWPDAERKLAKMAAKYNIPYGLSTVAAAAPEDVGPHAGDNGWFQFYPAANERIREDILDRAWDSGFKKLILTVDVPGENRRERQRRALLQMPPKITPSMVLTMMLHPRWSLGMAKVGMPKMKLCESYVTDADRNSSAFTHAGRIIRGYPDWTYLDWVRKKWQGDLIIKGILDPKDAKSLVDAGADAIWVSNHATRQFEACPAAIHQLPKVREAVGSDFPLIYDSGVENGLDILRAFALGANFVFLGKAFHFALAAMDSKGVDHLIHILSADMKGNMSQIGAHDLKNLAEKLVL